MIVIKRLPVANAPRWIRIMPSAAQFNRTTKQQAVIEGNEVKITTYPTIEKYEQELNYMRLWSAGTQASVWEVNE